MSLVPKDLHNLLLPRLDLLVSTQLAFTSNVAGRFPEADEAAGSARRSHHDRPVLDQSQITQSFHITYDDILGAIQSRGYPGVTSGVRQDGGEIDFY